MASHSYLKEDCRSGLGQPGREGMVAFVMIAAQSVCSGVVSFALGWRSRTQTSIPAPPEELLHWNPAVQRRGLGGLIKSVNHVALIVSDVGRSLAFYTEIIGFQQIQRPNFDRHGAWLTMGNTELHLIKGVPNAPSGKDLIVSHIALDSDDPEGILKRLLEMNVPFRQNISVPDPKKARENLVESFENADGKVTQYFIRDPDGYYWELCNCDILTKFCLFKEKHAENLPCGGRDRVMSLMDRILGGCVESGLSPKIFRCPQLFKISVIASMWVSRARRNLRSSWKDRLERELLFVQPVDHPNPHKLACLVGRQKTYCDLTQGFAEEELAEALRTAGNSVPVALLILASKRQHMKVALPPQYLLSEGGKIHQQTFQMPRRKSLDAQMYGTEKMFAPKPFYDNLPA